MKRFIGARLADSLLALLVILAIWKTLTLFYPPLVVPGISAVASKFLAIVSDAGSLGIIGLTAVRLLAGLGLGVAAGGGLGILLGCFPFLNRVFRPILGLVQSVPPVSWLALALIWFGFNGRPSVFIVALSILPTMTLNLVEGIRGIDPRLLEMGRVYGFSRWKRLRYIAAPSVLPYFRSGLAIAVGVGCKAVVMGEVLTTNTGVGGAITDARLNIEPESVVAWTATIVLLYYLLDRVSARLLRDRKGGPC